MSLAFRRLVAGGAALLAVVAMLTLPALPAWTQPEAESQPAALPADLADLSLEQLLNIEVTSVSKKAQRLSDAAAAIHVITREDLRRSGAVSLPEALRLAPGLEVARIDAGTWAVGARGFNSQFSNKLLVLVDGRTIYTPAFSGVYWDAQDIDLEDVERIEVIRGPGATVWGANAVNGVINVITRPAAKTQDLEITSGGGTEDLGFGRVRGGGRLAENAHYRLYGRFSQRDGSAAPAGGATRDGGWSGRAGFRMDWEDPDHGVLTIEGDGYRAEPEQVITLAKLDPPYTETTRFRRRVEGGHVLGRWSRPLGDAADLTLQLYYDRADRRQLYDRERVETLDLDAEHRFRWIARQEVVWGLGFRLVQDDFANTFTLALDPARRTARVFSGFLQDELGLIENRLSLVVGSKFEHNDYTGVELQPTARLGWSLRDRQTLWAAVSRAARTPSRWEDDVRINVQATPGPTVVAVLGNRNVVSEQLTAYELGYRIQPHPRASFDLATFYNVYDRLRSFEPGAFFFESSPPPDHAVIPLQVDNRLAGETRGAELAARWRPLNGWELQAGYTWLRLQMRRLEGGQDPSFEKEEGSSPQNQASLRSSMDLPLDLELDFGLRYVDFLPALRMPSYIVPDIRVGWRPSDRVEIAVTGQNLLDRPHPEFLPAFLDTQATEVEPSLCGRISWRLSHE